MPPPRHMCHAPVGIRLHFGMVGHLFYFGVPPIYVSKAEPAKSHNRLGSCTRLGLLGLCARLFVLTNFLVDGSFTP